MVETTKEIQEVKADKTAENEADMNASSTSAGLTSSASEGEVSAYSTGVVVDKLVHLIGRCWRGLDI